METSVQWEMLHLGIQIRALFHKAVQERASEIEI